MKKEKEKQKKYSFKEIVKEGDNWERYKEAYAGKGYRGR